MDLYFSRKYKPGNTLLFFNDDVAVAGLQLLPYTIRFWGTTLPFYYLSGLCTLPEYRRRGFMSLLIGHSTRLMTEREIALSILVPAEETLFGYYEQFGYEQVFEEDKKELPLQTLLTQHPDLQDAYAVLDREQKRHDCCVQKSWDDFDVIVKDFRSDDYPRKANLAGMAKLIDIERLTGIYRTATGHKLEINKDSDGKIRMTVDKRSFVVSERLLCRLLFGYKTKELGEELSRLFPEQQPCMNLMLE